MTSRLNLTSEVTDQRGLLMGEANRKWHNKDWQFCAYCGAPRTSRDHIPPKSLFVGITDPITVPACDLHNGMRSGLDERFRDFIAFLIGELGTDQTTDELIKRSIRGIRYNRPRFLEMVRQTQWLPKIDRYAVALPREDFEEGMKWICRGLYWHHHRTPLPLSTPIESHLLRREFLEANLPIFSALPTLDRIGSQFLCRGGITEDYPTASVWLMVFHSTIPVLVVTDGVAALEAANKL